MGNYDFELDLKSVNTMSVINEWIKKETNILEFGPANGRLTKYLKYEKIAPLQLLSWMKNQEKKLNSLQQNHILEKNMAI